MLKAVSLFVAVVVTGGVVNAADPTEVDHEQFLPFGKSSSPLIFTTFAHRTLVPGYGLFLFLGGGYIPPPHYFPIPRSTARFLSFYLFLGGLDGTSLCCRLTCMVTGASIEAVLNVYNSHRPSNFPILVRQSLYIPIRADKIDRDSNGEVTKVEVRIAVLLPVASHVYDTSRNRFVHASPPSLYIDNKKKKSPEGGKSGRASKRETQRQR